MSEPRGGDAPVREEPRSAVLLVDAGTPGGGPTRLAAELGNALGEGWTVHTALLDGDPPHADHIEASALRLVASGVRSMVVVSTSPHYAPGADAPALGAVYRALGRTHVPVALRTHPCWHDDAGYVSALARSVADLASARGLSPADTHLRFVAPRPASGDASTGGYRARLRRTLELVAERVGWPLDAASLGFEREVETCEPGGLVLVCPLSPVSTPRPAGEGIHVCDPLYGAPAFLAALKRLVLKGARPVAPSKRAPEPLLRTRRPPARDGGSPDDARLVLLGASLRGVLARGAGPRLRHSDPHAFARVKKSHQDVGAFLEWIREATPLREAFLWNTCQRSELYAWLSPWWDSDGQDALLGRLRRALFRSEPEGLAVTVLEGAQARHHLLRTACGLNSDLPGDRDVAAQLCAALQRAKSAGTAGAAAIELVEETVSVVEDVNARTSFGDFSTGYCAAALTRVFEAEGLLPASLRHVTVGGSTTSRSVLETLRSDHHVAAAQLTAVYRGHHGQMKRLRAALGGGRRLRVHGYGDERVLHAVRDADVVYLGIDQPETVMLGSCLARLRDLDARPLTVVDFNSFGSIEAPSTPSGLRIWSAADIDDAVAAHAAITTTRTAFAAALGEAEAWIARHVAGREEASSSAQDDARPGARVVRPPC